MRQKWLSTRVSLDNSANNTHRGSSVRLVSVYLATAQQRRRFSTSHRRGGGLYHQVKTGCEAVR